MKKKKKQRELTVEELKKLIEDMEKAKVYGQGAWVAKK